MGTVMSTIDDQARADQQWTPSTEQVRSHYVFNQSNRWDPARGEAFDRWIAEHDADILAASRREPSELTVACPHWSPGRITMRKGCTSCEADAEPSDTDERSIEEKYFETLAKIDPSQEMARVIAQARRDLAKRRDTDEREWEYALKHELGWLSSRRWPTYESAARDSNGSTVVRRTKHVTIPAGQWEEVHD